MTGPEHYQKAQELLESADQATEASTEYVGEALAAAQVHATLALAAATAADLRNGDLMWSQVQRKGV